jgi:hypothetical protein
MTLKLRLAVLASALTLAAGLAIGVSGTAYASSNSFLCVHPSNHTSEIQCAYVVSQGAGAKIRMTTTSSDWDVWSVAYSGYTNIFPEGEDFNNCLEVVGSYIVELETCGSAHSEEFTAAGLGSGHYEWVNESDGRCLNDDVSAGYLNVAPCNGGTNESWFND